MRLLLTNDDGIDAPGLAALVAAAQEFGEITVVAPAGPQSNCSHSATTDRPLQIVERRPGWFAVAGTPVDCVRLALLQLAPAVDWVLSGINDGGNLGVDIYMSGTVAAAREAMLLRKPAVAISQYRKKGRAADWERSARDGRAALRTVLARPFQAGMFWNANLPDHDLLQADSIVECFLDPHPLPLTLEAGEHGYIYKSNYQQRLREPGGDVEACFSGQISVTSVSHYPR